jgi:NAD-dependent deacetylase
VTQRVSLDGLRPLMEAVDRRRPLTVLTGAGISAESGVPTFRGDGGYWKARSAQELATPEAFARDPKLVWSFYQHRRRIVAERGPNAGHFALVDLERRRSDVWVITQNVDGFHQDAGSLNLVEMHGSLWRVRCISCGRSVENRDLDFEDPPECERCGGLMRPAVVWFGESFRPEVLSEIDSLLARGGVMLVVGTSGQVAPAAFFARIARSRGATTVEVNPEGTVAESDMDFVVREPAGKALPTLLMTPKLEG